MWGYGLIPMVGHRRCPIISPPIGVGQLTGLTINRQFPEFISPIVYPEACVIIGHLRCPWWVAFIYPHTFAVTQFRPAGFIASPLDAGLLLHRCCAACYLPSGKVLVLRGLLVAIRRGNTYFIWHTRYSASLQWMGMMNFWMGMMFFGMDMMVFRLL